MAFDLTCLATVQANRQSRELLLGRLALRHALELVARDRAVVAVLHQQAAGDRLERRPAARGSGSSPVSSRRRFFLRAKIALAVLVGIRRDDDFGEDLGDRLGRRRVERPVDRDDAAERRDAVAGERLASRPRTALSRGRDAARVGVLDDHHRRLAVAELGDELERGIGVVEIVVAELLALDLLGLGDAARRAGRAAGRAPPAGAGSRHSAAAILQR